MNDSLHVFNCVEHNTAGQPVAGQSRGLVDLLRPMSGEGRRVRLRYPGRRTPIRAGPRGEKIGYLEDGDEFEVSRETKYHFELKDGKVFTADCCLRNP